MTETDYSEQISQQITVLSDKVKAWEDNELKASNQKLYGILGECLDLAEHIKAKRKRLDGLNDVIEKRGLRFKGKTTTLRKVVKLVFGADRQRSSAYSLVLEMANDEGITSKELAKWIEKQGGIEEIRTGGGKSGASKENMRQLGQQHLQDAQPIAKVNRSKHTPDESGYVVMLGYVDNNGSTQVLTMLEHDTLVKQVTESVGRQIFAERKEQNKSLTADELIEELSQKATDKAA